MRVHLWFEGMFVLSLYGAAILNTAYDKCGVHQYVRWLILCMKLYRLKLTQVWYLIGEREWVYEKRRSDVFRSKINIRVAPKHFTLSNRLSHFIKSDSLRSNLKSLKSLNNIKICIFGLKSNLENVTNNLSLLEISTIWTNAV